MTAPKPGDLVTFPLRGGHYGVAHLVHIDDLALNDLYHFAICDAVVDGSMSSELDAYGDPVGRVHDRADVDEAPILIEHISVTRHGLEATDVAVVSSREVDDDALRGYRTWLHLRYQDAVQRGLLRDRVDDNPDEIFEEPDEERAIDEEVATVEAHSGAEEAIGDTGAEEPSDDDVSDDDASATPVASATTLGVHDVALGDALVRQRMVFERDEYRDSTLARYILGLGEDRAAIDAIVARMVDGDFAAGDELIDFGEAGMRALGEQLRDDVAPELADDILQVLVNSGEPVAYERVAAFMAEHGARAGDPLHGAAVRGYCYAVMLTAGEPEALKERLAMLEAVGDPELADDIRSAREALAGEG